MLQLYILVWLLNEPKFSHPSITSILDKIMESSNMSICHGQSDSNLIDKTCWHAKVLFHHSIDIDTYDRLFCLQHKSVPLLQSFLSMDKIKCTTFIFKFTNEPTFIVNKTISHKCQCQWNDETEFWQVSKFDQRLESDWPWLGAIIPYSSCTL